MVSNSNRYKVLLSYLPGMATVVNSFDSDAVQQQVYNMLIEALNEKEGFSGINGSKPSRPVVSSNGSSKTEASPDAELVHDIVDGASIHADMED